MLINFLWIFQNCGPKEYNWPTYLIDQTTIDFCIYDKGSWWVYQEESSGKMDTVVTIALHRELSKNDKLGSIRELLTMKNNSKRLGDFSLVGGPARNRPDLDIADESFNIPPHAFGDLLFVSTLDTSFIYVWTSIDQIKLKDTLTRIMIKDKSYTDIRIFENLSGSYPSHQKVIYWARHIGKIRIERADGEVWNLIDYHVSQDNL